MNKPPLAKLSALLCLATGLLASTASLALDADPQTAVVRLSEPVEKTASSETFGAPFPASASAISLQQLAADADKHLAQDVAVTTDIAQVCQKKGCFFIAQDGDTTMRVSFKDYGFFLPTDSGGKAVDLYGVLTQKHVSKKAAQHFAKDIGVADASIATGLAYEFVASSVRIRNAGSENAESE